MGHSNNGFSDSDETSELFDSFEPVPEAGANELLDSLLERKHLEPADLVRAGARYNPQRHELVYRYGQTLRFRHLLTNDIRSHPPGSQYPELKIISVGSSKVIVVEGETDAGRVSGRYKADVAIMPAGAEAFKPRYQEQLEPYERVYVALDHDDAGNRGSAKIMRALGDKAQRFSPAPANDWCALETLPPLPEPPQPPPVFVSGAELFEMEWPEVASYFDSALLPMTGILMLHGWKHSYKSWLAFDIAVALAEGGSWADVPTTAEAPVPVAIVQFEIPAPFYVERMQLLEAGMQRRELFRNVKHISPMMWPTFVAGNRKHEDAMMAAIAASGARVAVFDPIRQMIGARSMNDEEAQQQLVQFFRRLNHEGIAVLCTTHDSKTSARHGGGSSLDATGAPVVGGVADSTISVELPDGATHETSKRRNLRFICRNAAPLVPRRLEMDDDTSQLQYAVGSWDAEPESDSEPKY